MISRIIKDEVFVLDNSRYHIVDIMRKPNSIIVLLLCI